MTSDSMLLDHSVADKMCQMVNDKWRVNGVVKGKERIYVGLLDRSVLLCLHLRCEQMACLNSVKQRTIIL